MLRRQACPTCSCGKASDGGGGGTGARNSANSASSCAARSAPESDSTRACASAGAAAGAVLRGTGTRTSTSKSLCREAAAAAARRGSAARACCGAFVDSASTTAKELELASMALRADGSCEGGRICHCISEGDHVTQELTEITLRVVEVVPVSTTANIILTGCSPAPTARSCNCVRAP